MSALRELILRLLGWRPLPVRVPANRVKDEVKGGQRRQD